MLPEHLGLYISWWKQLGKFLGYRPMPGSYLAVLESPSQLKETQRVPIFPEASINSL